MATTYRTTSAEQTQALAAALAELVGPGDLLLLAGDLGAGKTAFTQGLGRGLGVHERITSPTFTLHNRYEGRIRLDHLDVYRLDQLDEVSDLGLAEMLDEQCVIAIEWGDTIAPVLPADHLEVRLVAGPGDDDRAIQLRPAGPGWAARLPAVERALAPWADGGPAGEGGSC
jgi:tRNA threonylcarbamoyladenosine biosynthesis protein TsaE